MQEIDNEYTDPDQAQSYRQAEMDRLLERDSAFLDNSEDIHFTDPVPTTKPGKFADPAMFMNR